MRVSRQFGVLAILAGVLAAPVHADDPRDPAMTPEAIARDSAQIRRMNREQLDYVRRRDAGNAQGWRDVAQARAGRNSDTGSYGEAGSYDDADADMRADYARQRRRYESAVRDWQQDVAACRAGYYERCDRR